MTVPAPDVPEPRHDSFAATRRFDPHWVENAQNRIAAEDALQAERWDQYLLWIGRPYRFYALLAILDPLGDAEYWRLLRTVWDDAEDLFRWRRVIPTLLESARSNCELLMNERERAYLATLPDIVTIYRGYDRGHRSGWSWTLSEACAEWFAKRFSVLEGRVPRVAVGTVAKGDIIAYLAGRQESEIVVNPVRVRRVRSHTLDVSPMPTANATPIVSLTAPQVVARSLALELSRPK